MRIEDELTIEELQYQVWLGLCTLDYARALELKMPNLEYEVRRDMERLINMKAA